MVELAAMGSLTGKKDIDRMKKWEAIFERELIRRTNGLYKYQCQARKVMFGCFIMVFTREDKLQATKNFKKCSIRTGAAGLAANKGSCAIRFELNDSSFMFVNLHATSG